MQTTIDSQPTAAGSTLPVSLQGIEKTYRSGSNATHVLRGVDFTAEREECVFLVGPSGSGKTTLLSILGCILSPDAGTVVLHGQDVLQLCDTERTVFRRSRIGFVFQRFNLIRGLSALDNVVVPLALQGSAGTASRARAAELLAQVGLAEKGAAKIQQLSSGQRQRVALARALAADPDLILADEPTASLDAENGREVMTLLRRLTAEQGKTAIVVTHDERIFPFADRICRMDEGRLIGADRATDLPVPDASIQRVYGEGVCAG